MSFARKFNILRVLREGIRVPIFILVRERIFLKTPGKFRRIKNVFFVV